MPGLLPAGSCWHSCTANKLPAASAPAEASGSEAGFWKCDFVCFHCMCFLILSDALSTPKPKAGGGERCLSHRCSGVLTLRLELAIKISRFRTFPNHAEEISAFCRHIYHFLHGSCSHTQGVLTQDDSDIPLILENPHMFRNPDGSVCLLQDHPSSHLSSWCSCLVQSGFLSTQLTYVGLLWVSQPFPINCWREFWSWGLGLATRLTGDMEKGSASVWMFKYL